MEGKGSRRSSSLALLSLALVLSGGVAAAAQRPPSTKKARYMLMEVHAGGEKPRLAMREDGSAVAGFANRWKQWFATPGSESLLASYGYYSGGTGNSRGRSTGDNAAVGQGGLSTLLAMAMVANNNDSAP